MQQWGEFWSSFLESERLIEIVDILNELDFQHGKPQTVEDICKGVYEKYDRTDEERLKKIRTDFMACIESISHIHLSTSRVKSIDSVLRKIITKRYDEYDLKGSLYAKITDDTYQDALTDLVGVRVILSYRGNWKAIHDQLIKKFPLKDRMVYNAGLLKHVDGTAFMAEWPKAYHAAGDDVSSFVEAGLDVKPHKKGYRSIHYTISFMDTYIELQIRTIYDEAWSDVDHRYVYKQEANPSNEALVQMSRMLCKLTNLSNDIGEQMKAIYDGNTMSRADTGGEWVVSSECKTFFSSVINRLDECRGLFVDMCEKMVVPHEDE